MPPLRDPIPSSSPMSEPRFWHLVEHLHELGTRSTGELLREVITGRTLPIEIAARLERYGQVDPDVLRALGADQTPPMPLHSVQK